MGIEIPELPIGIAALIGVFAPYAVSMLNGYFPQITNSTHRKWVSVIVGLVVAAVVITFYIAMTGDAPVTWVDWAWLIGLTSVASVGAIQGSYNLVVRESASKLEAKIAGRTAVE